MAHKKAGGSSRNGRDSIGQRLGIKKFGGERVRAGNILVRQRGSTYHAGTHVGVGKDFTLFALCAGTLRFHRGKGDRRYISVLPQATRSETDSGAAAVN